ncbi:MAG: 4-(cytidine 5'-diphospho)-2-C-methyl-D-erythritol kinase [Terriglobales bacterium]
MPRLCARAYAKINLGLKIGPRRHDGFHELRTIYQTVTLADRVEINLGSGSGCTLAASGLAVPLARDNLAVRAAEAAVERWNIRGRIEIHLHKVIPLGAGLGGGSSDAAAVLRLLAVLCRRPPPLRELLHLARSLGSDVPLFLLGGTVLGLGRGDEVYALQDLPAWHCVLAMPCSQHAAGISTPAAFARWDHCRPLTAAAGSDTLLEFCSLVDQVLPAFRNLRNRGSGAASSAQSKVHAGIENDFLPEVLSVSPDFLSIHRELRRAGSVWTGLTGSGAAQFGLFADPGTAAAAASRLARLHCSWPVRFVRRALYARGLRRLA